MSISNDPGHYFQTSDSLAATERRAAKSKNKHGDPIKLPSKILSVCGDPNDPNAVFVSESAGEVKRVSLENKQITTLRPATGAPLTSLAIVPGHSTQQQQHIYAGSWDKTIHPVSLPSSIKTQDLPPRLKGHTDFVKCLLATHLNNEPILISGSADATIIIWDLLTSKPIHKLPGHGSAQQALAIDPLSLPDDPTSSTPVESFVLFTASSAPEIRRWHISRTHAHELPESLTSPITAHATSIYALEFDGAGDLWTASADKSARHLVRDRDWEPDTVLEHPDFVRDVVVSERMGCVVTACRDEEVRVWDLGTGELWGGYGGHFEEVTGLVVVDAGMAVVSVSIDGTVRKWSLKRGDMDRFMEERAREERGEDGGEVEGKKGKKGLMTAEEEAELAELMDEDDGD